MRKVCVGLVLLSLLWLGPSAFAAIPDADGVIHGCRDIKSGSIRIIDSATETCTKHEVALNWNLAGPVGPMGPPGAAGSGPMRVVDATGQLLGYWQQHVVFIPVADGFVSASVTRERIVENSGGALLYQTADCSDLERVAQGANTSSLYGQAAVSTHSGHPVAYWAAGAPVPFLYSGHRSYDKNTGSISPCQAIDPPVSYEWSPEHRLDLSVFTAPFRLIVGP